jgi:hypothetical protein
MVERERRADAQAQARLQAAEDALASVPEEVERDRLLDFAVNLRAEIAGRIEGGRSVAHLNRTTELLNGFTITHELEPDPRCPEEVENALQVGSVLVHLNLRWEVIGRFIAAYDEDEPAPPMEWIEALSAADGKSANSHPFADKPRLTPRHQPEPGLALPPIRVGVLP